MWMLFFAGSCEGSERDIPIFAIVIRIHIYHGLEPAHAHAIAMVGMRDLCAVSGY